MQSATQTLTRATSSGRPLPMPPAVAGLRPWFTFRRGLVCMVTAAPKRGKSAFIQWLVVNMDVPTLYFSADMDSFTAGTRHATIQTGDKFSDVYHQIDTNGPGLGYYEEALLTSKVSYCFDPSPDLPDVQAEVDAYVEVWDRYPEVIVIDNLLNMQGAEDDKNTQQFLLRNFNELARTTGALVIIAHHASEANLKDPGKPPPAREVQNKVTEYPGVVLGLAHDAETGDFHIAVTANRHGKSDPAAKHPLTIHADLGRMQFQQFRMEYA